MGIRADNQCQVRTLKGPVRLLDTELAQFAFIVYTCGINEDTRAEPEHFHCLEHRVGSGARNVGNQCHFLVGDGIDKGRLSAVALAEKSDMEAVGHWGIVYHTDKALV